jgi:hypothetical protein
MSTAYNSGAANFAQQPTSGGSLARRWSASFFSNCTASRFGFGRRWLLAAERVIRWADARSLTAT